MKKKFLYILLCLLTFPVFARGGAQQLYYQSGYLIRDTIGNTTPTCSSASTPCWGWYGAPQVYAAGRINFQGNASPSRFPYSTTQWLIEPGDESLFSCCGIITERNELLDAFNSSGNDVTVAGTTHYIAFSIFMPSNWQDPPINGNCPYNWFIAFQLHPQNAYSLESNPDIALDLSTVPGHYTLSQEGGEDTTGGVSTTTDLGTHVLNTWTDILIKVVYKPDNTGSTTVWTRTGTPGQTTGPLSGTLQQQALGTGVALPAWLAPTIYMHNGTVTPQYYKHGAYRCQASFTSTLYTGPFVIANNMQDAATAAFGQWP